MYEDYNGRVVGTITRFNGLIRIATVLRCHMVNLYKYRNIYSYSQRTILFIWLVCFYSIWRKKVGQWFKYMVILTQIHQLLYTCKFLLVNIWEYSHLWLPAGTYTNMQTILTRIDHCTNLQLIKALYSWV